MAATPDHYVTNSGGQVSAGRFRLPAWRRAMSVGTWGAVSAHTMAEVDPAADPAYNPNYPYRAPWCLLVAANANLATNNGAVTPWCGATITPDGRIKTGIGGGHSDYGGNEDYEQDLTAEDPQWRMVRPPSGSVPLIAGGLPAGSTAQVNSFLLDDGLETTGVYADGRPRAIHSYRKHTYVPNVGLVLVVQGNTFSAAETSEKKTWLQDESTGEWVWKSTASTLFQGGTSGGASCYDSLRNCVYWQGAGASKLLKLDINTWTFSIIGTGASVNATGDVSIVYIPELDVIFHACSFFTNKFVIRDPVTSTSYTPSVTGVTPPSIDGATGMGWVPSLGAMVFLTSSTGALHTLKPTGNPKTDHWEWAVLSTSTAPPALTTVGVYGKFGYSARLKGLYRVGQNTIPTWFYATE